MTGNLMLCIVLLSFFTTCQAQNTPAVITNNKNSSIVDTIKVERVKEIGKNIMLVFQDRKNNYWFGSWEDGLYKYDGKTILHFTTESGLPANRIDEIKEDRSGNVYFTSASSPVIIKYDGEKFSKLKETQTDNQWKLEANDTWFKHSGDSKFVYRFDGNYLHKLRLPTTPLGEDYIAANPTHPNPYSVYTIYNDSKGNVWFGTGALGAFRYNGKSFDWILEKDVVEIFNEPSEGSNGVRSIIEDKDGYFWFNSMYRYSVYQDKDTLNNTNGTFYSRERSVGNLDGKDDGNFNEYLSIAKDNNGDLWIATYTRGVYHFDGKKFEHYKITDGDKQINLFTVYKDNDGNLWLGTPENGAYKFNGKTFERFKP